MKISKKNIVLGILTVVLLWAISAILIYYFIGTENHGTFGDMFGAVNALFSGLALFGIIVSILIQQNELNLQRQELADTRLEFKTNRITNILFKQAEHVNNSLNRVQFFLHGTNEYLVPKNIDEFTSYLNKLKDRNRASHAMNYLESNSNIITTMNTEISAVLENFSELLNDSGLDEKEVLQMKKLMKSNLNPSITPFLILRLKQMRREITKFKEKLKQNPDDEVAKIEKSLIEIEIERITRILKFDKN